MQREVIGRLERLERNNRILLIACASMAACFPLACSKSGAAGNVIKAQRFVVVNSNGQERAIFFSDKDGAVLSLDDAEGKPRVGLSASKTRAGFEVFDDRGHSTIALTSEKGGSALALADLAGRPRTTVGLFGEKSWVAFLDQNGNPTYRVPAK